MNSNLIWVIEDDQMYRDTLVAAVRHVRPDAEIREFSTEHDAEEAIQACMKTGGSVPGLVISDVMLPYAFAEEGKKVVPDEWDEDRFREAGIRLWHRFREAGTADFKRTGWVYHTVLQPTTMGFDQNKDERTVYLGKDKKLKNLGDLVGWIFDDIDGKWDATEEEETELIINEPKFRTSLLESMKLPLRECHANLE